MKSHTSQLVFFWFFFSVELVGNITESTSSCHGKKINSEGQPEQFNEGLVFISVHLRRRVE